MDKIIIVNATYSCNLGVTEEERALKQIIILSMHIQYNLQKAGKSDVISDTLDYSLVNKEIRTFLESRSFCLIETIAEEVAQKILHNYPVRTVKVCIKKPAAMKNADCAAVEIIRKKVLLNSL